MTQQPIQSGPASKQTVLAALASVPHPASGQDLVAAGCVLKAAWCDGLATATLALPNLTQNQAATVKQQAQIAIAKALQQLGEPIRNITVELAPTQQPTGHAPIPLAPNQSSAGPSIRHIIAVGAGKGGVGKSTVAVNLAVGLALRGHAVGILDGDIYGPSLPTMLGLQAMQANLLGNMLQPFLVHGVKAMTIGKLVDPEKALIWRGPMAHGAFKQLTEQTEWGELDYLIIDLPPGTGDVALSMAQMLKLTGAVVVCTPQKVAQDDAVRAVRMFQQLGIDVLGVVENMSYFIGDDGKEYDLFGRGGAQHMAQRMGIPFLGNVPINTDLRKNSDDGNPSANFQGPGSLPRDLDAMIKSVESQVALASIKAGSGGPVLTIS